MQKSFTRIGLMVFLILLVGGTVFAAVQGFLAVEAIDGVQVYVNGEMKGITVGGSSVLMLDPGSYRITLQKEGYSSTTQTVTIKAGEATNLKVNMTKPQVRGEALGADDKTVVLGQKTGTVEIRSVPFRGADIQINGVNYGQTDRRLSNMPVGSIRVQVTYNGKRLYGTFTVKENQTIQLQANYAMDPAQIIQLYDATFVLPDLSEGFHAELVGEYGSGAIVSGQQTRVMGSKHTVKYTNGKDYIVSEQKVDLNESLFYRLEIPESIKPYDVKFLVPELPENFNAELVCTYEKRSIISFQSTRVIGAIHTIRYTNGKDYIEFEQQVNLNDPTYVINDSIYIILDSPNALYFTDVLPTHSVVFESMGGSIVDPINGVVHGMRITSPDIPERTGCSFGGWYKDKELVDRWDFKEDSLDSDVTLYAKWIRPFVYTKGGTFQMGSNDIPSAKPIHAVTVKSFYMGGYEISQEIYQDVMGSNPSYWKGEHLPVENVDWYDAIEFCNALSRLDGLEEVYIINGKAVSCDWDKVGYRLPTEAEWEYAAKGGNKSQGYIYAGSNRLRDVAWYSSNSTSKTHEVGSKQANELGLYDMSGNVSEWCWDIYENYGISADEYPKDSSADLKHLVRGGDHYSRETYLNIANRSAQYAHFKNNSIGIRIVLPAK